MYKTRDYKINVVANSLVMFLSPRLPLQFAVVSSSQTLCFHSLASCSISMVSTQSYSHDHDKNWYRKTRKSVDFS